MYTGLLPKGLTEADLSPDEEEETEVKKQSCVGERRVFSVEAVGDSAACSLPGVSQQMWQKFQDLRRRNDEMKTTTATRRRNRKRQKKGKESTESSQKREHQEEGKKPWDELQQYFGVNDRFHPPAFSKPPPKSGLEKSIERAIAEGDIAKAEDMSDRLATRELAVKITEAADCRDFVRRKQEEEDLRAAQKRKKQIAWGFEAKKRWETKSNMGYM
ncbi:protein FAM204A isoform X2 [Thalassophryne amazonica]|uniref:protein FAM204A isoform X2 n=1 Tax=Thalassophryne amazonica TaxID=390379 RepID=UPI0014714BE3|nr:protein FAM204A isoform X2 [Thalassophryne amazonica]